MLQLPMLYIAMSDEPVSWVFYNCYVTSKSIDRF